ncbi:MAG: Flagellin protein FlaA [uncultured Phycisphaerae bacterium]|uniref:Flagellin n=1 Tax=uncultured Phycisphaerae bacterium TaxID=904963 RepID=A0A6J4PWI6_9BACT|nr:MAG: Flagellin protein FlaA [uncultured Phycisphaerae bacterium]
MSRINTNVSSLIAQRVLRKNNDSLNTSLERLSTGLKINRGADDPAGLIASENLRSEKAGIGQAIENAERASNIIGTAEGGLAEVSSLLNELQSLVGQAANTGGLSKEEIAANQLQVDSILGSINRIAGATAFQGAKLLNGNYAYQTSGVTASAFGNLQVNAARLPDGQAQAIVVQVANSATQGLVAFTGATTGTVTIEIAGNAGTEQLSFASGTTIASIQTAVNAISEATGVTASALGTNLSFKGSNYGADQFVSVRAISGTFAVTGGVSGKDFGSDADVRVNGAKAESNGVDVSYRSSTLDVEFKLSTKVGTVEGLNEGNTKTFGITGGGATFALGSKVTETDKASLGIASVSTGSLGTTLNGAGTAEFLSSLASGGPNSLDSGNLVQSQKILDKAVKQVSQLRGRLGAFQKFTIGSTVNSLGIALENASAAESAIRDTDFAEETAKLTRSQILSQAATTVLAQANASPQLALSLLQ